MKKEYSAALEAFHQCCCMYFFLVQRYKMADGEVRRAFRGAPHDRRHARALYEDAERRDATVRGRGLSGRTTGADVTITPEMLWSWSLSMPGPLWRTMQRLGGWIEPVLVAEWVRLTRAYALRMGLDLAPGAVEARMVGPNHRETPRWPASRPAAWSPQAGLSSVSGPGVALEADGLDVDHALPWSAWPCNDLWNLMPASRRVNQHEKRDRLPTAHVLAKARGAIVDG